MHGQNHIKKALYFHHIHFDIEIFLLDIEKNFKKQKTIKLLTAIRHPSRWTL